MKDSKVPRRMWINQPSTAQPLHDMHAMNGLYAVYAELERVAPWSQSNDMADVDEIMCAIGLLAQHRDALIARNAEQDKLIADITNAAADAAIKHRDIAQALIAENKALREAVSEYITARDDYNAATAPPNSHAMPRRIEYSDPRLLRYREASDALTHTPAKGD